MFLRSILPVATAAILGSSLLAAGPAAAQTTWTSPNGKTVMRLPAGYSPLGAGSDGTVNHFAVTRAGARVGTCSTSTEVDPEPASPEIWKIVISEELNSPAKHAQQAAINAGHGFVRYLGSRNFTSTTGFDGYLFWYERTNKTSGQTQTTISSGTLLDGFTRQVGLCTSASGQTFTSAEIDTAGQFLASARVN